MDDFSSSEYARPVRFTAAICFVLVIVNLLSILTLRPGAHSSNWSPHNDRQPASSLAVVGGQQELPRLERMLTLTLPCPLPSNIPTQKTTAKWLRLRGSHCQSSSKIQATQIHNRSLGSNALVFELPQDRFSSDYFSLQPGANRIWVNRILTDGKSLMTELSIDRE